MARRCSVLLTLVGLANAGRDAGQASRQRPQGALEERLLELDLLESSSLHGAQL